LDPIERAPAIVAGAFFIGFVIHVGFIQLAPPTQPELHSIRLAIHLRFVGARR
jgi:hypothetical protein